MEKQGILCFNKQVSIENFFKFLFFIMKFKFFLTLLILFSFTPLFGDGVKNFISEKNVKAEKDYFTYSATTPPFSEVRDLFSHTDKFVVFVCSENPKETLSKGVYVEDKVYEYSKENIIFIPLEIKIIRFSKAKPDGSNKKVRILKTDYAKLMNNRIPKDCASEFLLIWSYKKYANMGFIYHDARTFWNDKVFMDFFERYKNSK